MGRSPGRFSRQLVHYGPQLRTYVIELAGLFTSRYISAALDPEPNGPCPVAAKASTAPRLKMSLADPTSPARTCSGDRKPGLMPGTCGVPGPEPGQPGSVRGQHTFEGLRLRCTRSTAYMSRRSSASPVASSSTAETGKGPCSRTVSASDGPETYAVASHGAAVLIPRRPPVWERGTNLAGRRDLSPESGIGGQPGRDRPHHDRLAARPLGQKNAAVRQLPEQVVRTEPGCVLCLDRRYQPNPTPNGRYAHLTLNIKVGSGRCTCLAGIDCRPSRCERAPLRTAPLPIACPAGPGPGAHRGGKTDYPLCSLSSRPYPRKGIGAAVSTSTPSAPPFSSPASRSNARKAGWAARRGHARPAFRRCGSYSACLSWTVTELDVAGSVTEPAGSLTVPRWRARCCRRTRAAGTAPARTAGHRTG